MKVFTTRPRAKRFPSIIAVATIAMLSLLATTFPALPAHAQEGSNQRSTQFGVHEFNIAARSGDLNRTADVTEVGASFIRLPITWHLMEGSAKGQVPGWFWAELDADIAAAEEAGLEVLITFGQTPCWASSDPLKNCAGNDDTYLSYLPSNPQDFADAFAMVVQRYGNRVMAWEIWNEPNLSGNLRSDRCLDRGACVRPADENDEWMMFGDLGSAYEYAELVRSGAAAAVQVDPDAKVLVGSIAGGDRLFLEHLYEAGLGDDYYAISAHPYTGPIPGDSNGTSYGPNDCPRVDRNANFWCFGDGVEALHQVMTDYGDQRDIWFTEFGFASTDTWNGSGLEGQAEHLREAVELIDTWDFVPVAAWYQLLDQGPDDREGTFGLFDQSGAIKPAGATYRDLLTGDIDPNPDLSIELMWPIGRVQDWRPLYEWTAVPGATRYLVWVNQYGLREEPGRINRVVTAGRAGCDDGVCEFWSRRSVKPAGEWWVTALFPDGTSLESQGASFHS
ncbi:MAG: cellulase family glycosylhydrolase [Acidimicrobiales bacterium]